MFNRIKRAALWVIDLPVISHILVAVLALIIALGIWLWYIITKTAIIAWSLICLLFSPILALLTFLEYAFDGWGSLR
ncbi:hypothetical protein CJ97_gp10 [Ralstonia phage RSB2]|uniref:Uncharacterized protein ORF10 n=1 Tax=Ralstonia phage RSB2 TaxID=913183 RepID=E5RUZ0_9CAUD|nr:hypothetical protein CJ97_gp10 [Ralstonia phage RSB2]BAJ51798.1 hypothetical protein [Ralstonia phage RSB2]